MSVLLSIVDWLFTGNLTIASLISFIVVCLFVFVVFLRLCLLCVVLIWVTCLLMLFTLIIIMVA